MKRLQYTIAALVHINPFLSELGRCVKLEVSGFPAPKKVLIVTVDVKQHRTYVLQFLRVKPGREKDVFGPLRSTSLSFSQTVTEGRQAGKKKERKKRVPGSGLTSTG